MSVPLFINSWIKLLYWFLYTTLVFYVVTFIAVSLRESTNSPVAWCVLLSSPFFLSLGYYFQHVLIHKKMIPSPIVKVRNPVDLSYWQSLTDKIIIEFLNKQEPLAFPYLTRVKVVSEVNSFIADPHRITQGEYHLCGPAAILYALAYAQPNALKEFCLAFAEDPKSVGLSLPTRCYNEHLNLSITTLIMMALAHRFNRTGYHPIHPTLERLQGVSTPKQLVNWTVFFDKYLNTPLEKIRTNEALVMRNRNQQPLSWIHNMLLGNLYSNKHVETDSFQSLFDELLKEQNTSIILLLSMKLCLKILGEDDTVENQTIFGVEVSHYVYLNQLTFNKTNETLSITISTSGICARNNISLDEFRQGFCGFFAWDNFKTANVKKITSISPCEELNVARLNMLSLFKKQTPIQPKHEQYQKDARIYCIA